MSTASNTISTLEAFENGNVKESYILHIPHSSIHIPNYTINNDVYEDVMKLTDHYTDALFNIAGVDKLVFKYNRLYCDVERFENDIFDAEGMGFYYTKSEKNTDIRDGNDKQYILENIYREHHKKLTEMVQEKLDKLSYCRLIDCHSFSETPYSRDKDRSTDRPDICLGVDFFHTPKHMYETFFDYFERNGFSVKINSPYSGCMVPMKFYNINKNVECIMIEVNKKLYMNESNYSIDMDKVSNLNKLFSKLII